MAFINGNDPSVPFSERKLQSGEASPLTFDELVIAQGMDCAGVDVAAIALELGRTVSDIEQALNPVRQARRPERSNIGFASLKGR